MAVVNEDVFRSRAFCETEAVLSRCSFTWIMKNVTFLKPLNETEPTCSQSFYSGPQNTYKWNLKLFLHLSNTNYKILISPSPNIKFAKIDCQLLNSANANIGSGAATIDNREDLHRREDPFMNTECILWITKPTTALPSDVLKLVFNGTVSTKTSVTFVPAQQINFTKVPEEVTNYLSSMWNQKKYSDFSICVGDKTFSVHKVILASNSPVFERMFQSDFVETATNCVKIDDFDSETVEAFLKFVYSQNVPDFTDLESTCSLYEMAEKYDVHGLREVCNSYFVSKLWSGDVHDVKVFMKRKLCRLVIVIDM